jgi:hypothetical protein
MFFGFSSCKKYLDVGFPPDKIVADYIYSSDKSAANVLTGIYYDLQASTSFSQGRESVSLQMGLQSDEIAAPPGSYLNANYRNNTRFDFWSRMYKLVYRTNAALHGLTGSSTLSADVKEKLLGEAYFLRAFCYFYLVNLYGDVPIITSPEYKTNALAARSPVTKVYEQIISDLNLAKGLLTDGYWDASITKPSDDRVRPNKWAATALLARAYLYAGSWKDASEEATLVIDQKASYDTVPLNSVFLKNSKEAIWQLQPSYEEGTFNNTLDAQLYILSNGPNSFLNPVVASDFLLNTFELTDKRKDEWIGINTTNDGKTYFFPFKYKFNLPDVPNEEFVMVLRLAEQYLIRAEAKLKLGDEGGAKADLNVIRARAGLPNTNASGPEQLMTAILKERQVELFTEWGHRWFDLKRTGKLDDVMKVVTPLKGGTWSSYKQLFDIPISDLRYNVNLKQNDGYPSS